MRGERKEGEARHDKEELKGGVPQLVLQGSRGKMLIGFEAESKEHCYEAKDFG